MRLSVCKAAPHPLRSPQISNVPIHRFLSSLLAQMPVPRLPFSESYSQWIAPGLLLPLPRFALPPLRSPLRARPTRRRPPARAFIRLRRVAAEIAVFPVTGLCYECRLYSWALRTAAVRIFTGSLWGPHGAHGKVTAPAAILATPPSSVLLPLNCSFFVLQHFS